MRLRRLFTGVAAMAAMLLVGASAAQADTGERLIGGHAPTFNPSGVVAACPDTTGSSVLSGNINDHRSLKYNRGYTVDMVLTDGSGAQVDSGSASIAPLASGNYSFSVDGLGEGQYNAEVTLTGHGWALGSYSKTITSWNTSLTVEVEACALLANLAVDVAPNVCPATTTGATFTGAIENFNAEDDYVINAAIYTADGVLVEYDPALAFDDEGNFSYDVSDLEAGEYYVSVNLNTNGVDGESEAVPFEVEIADCGVLADLTVEPNPAQNVCPATTADTTFSGAIENFNAEDDYVINAAIYTADGVLVEYDPALAFDDEGNFSYDVSDLEAGEYYVSVNLNTNGVDGESEAVPFEVEISECATLVDMAFEPNPVQNVCPATTGDTTLTGVIENFNEDDDYTVGVGIYAVGNDDVISELSDSDIEINDDGTFSFDVNGVDAGEYYASVSLTVNGEWVNTWAVDFEVDISECAIDDGDDNGEEGEDEGDDKGDDSDKGEDETTDPVETLPEDEDDVLSETGVSPALLITMALGLGGSGFLIRRFAL